MYAICLWQREGIFPPTRRNSSRPQSLKRRGKKKRKHVEKSRRSLTRALMIPSALIASTSVGRHTIFKSRHKNKKDAARNRLRRMRTGQKVEAAIGFLPLIPLSLPLQTSVVNDSDASRRRRRRCSPLSLSLSQHRRERGPSASPHRMLIRLHSISSRLLTLKKRA